METDDRCLITPYMIQCELEHLAGLPRKSTTLLMVYDAVSDEHSLRWNVDKNFFVSRRAPAKHRRLSLDNFSRRHCVPMVETMRNSLVRQCLRSDLAPSLITHSMIQAELERLAGLSKGSTSLHVIHDGERMLWQVGNRFIRVGPVQAADLQLSLDDFVTLHCEPVMEKLRENADG